MGATSSAPNGELVKDQLPGSWLRPERKETETKIDNNIATYADGAAKWALPSRDARRAWSNPPRDPEYLPERFKTNENLALDAAIPPATTTDPNAGIPAILTTMIDPEVFRIIFAPMKAAEIVGEVRRDRGWTRRLCSRWWNPAKSRPTAITRRIVGR